MATSVTFDIIGRDKASAAAMSAGKSLETLSGKISSAGKKMTQVGSSMTRSITLPVAAAGVAAVKLASDFDSSMQHIVGLVGVSQKQVNAWSKQILDLSKTLPQSPKELADAMYFITSAGISGKDALDALTQSARASAAGLGDTQSVADAVTSAMNAYGSKTLSASKATDILVEAVKAGKIEADQLAPVIGRVIPLASQMGISFDQVTAALAAMSTTGTDAAEGATQVSAIMSSLLKPSVGAAKAMATVGLSFEGLRKEVKDKGLFETLMHVKDAFHGNDSELAKVIPNIRALRGFLALTGKQADASRKIFDDMAHSTGVADKAFASASKTADFKLKSALSSLQSEGVELGNQVLPAVTSAVAKLIDGLDWFSGKSKTFKEVTLGAVLFFAALGPVLTVVGNLTRVFGGFVRILELTGQMQKQTAATTATATAVQKESAAATESQATATQGLSKAMAGVRFGAAVAGMAALTVASQTSNDKLKALSTVGGGALMGFAAGGPIGAAIGAGAGLLGVMATNIHKAADAAKASRADYSGLIGTLDSLTGATTSATRAFILDQLQRSHATDNLAAYGISQRTAVNALLGEAKARKVVSAAIGNQQSRYDSLLAQIKRLEDAQNADAGMTGARARTQTADQVARQKQIDSLKVQATQEKNVLDAVRNGMGVTKDAVAQKRRDIMATQELAGKLKGIPKRVQSKIEAKGIYPTIKGIADIARRYHLMPKQIRTLISAAGVDASVKQVEKAKHHLEDLSKTKPNMANFNEAVRRSGAIADNDAKRYGKAIQGSLEKGPKDSKANLAAFQASIRNGATAARGIASTGGHSVGEALSAGVQQGFSGTGAKLAAQAAGAINQAIAAARKAADAHSPSRKMAQLGRDLMDGLVQGIAGREMTVQNAMDRIQTIISKVGDKISNLMSTRSGFMGTFAPDSVFGADLSHTTTDAAGNDVTTPGTAGDALAYQKQQAAHAKQLLKDINRVTKMGLSKALVRQLESQGAAGEATLHALASGSPSQIKQLNRLNKQTSQSLRAAGMRAGNYTRGGSINDDIRRAQRQDRVLEKLEHTLHDLAESQKKGETIVVKIGDDAIIKAIRRYEHRKGSSSGSSL